MNPHLGVEIDCSSLGLASGRDLTEAEAASLFQSVVEHKVVALRSTGLNTTEAHQKLARQLQVASLRGTNEEKPDELLLEGHQRSPLIVDQKFTVEGCPAVLHI